MFGITSFAQSPFAGLGGNAYALTVAEAMTVASDAYAAQADFAGIYDESFAVRTMCLRTSTIMLT
jgi:hypothetical protein